MKAAGFLMEKGSTLGDCWLQQGEGEGHCFLMKLLIVKMECEVPQRP